MRRFIVFISKKIKGNSFHIDENLPTIYMYGFFFNFFFRLLRGYFTFFKYQKLITIGPSTSIVSKSNIVVLGKTLNIDKECHIDATSVNGILLGDKVSIQKRVIIECTGSIQKLGIGLVLGDNVGIGSCSFMGCAGGIEIGNDTIIGNFVSFHSENHNFSDQELPIRLQGVNHQGIKVGKNCWIGAKATILDGVEIMDGCIIAASALVTAGKYVENGIYGGVPAKLIKYRF